MARIQGNDGDNTLRGGAAWDVIEGFNGNDTLYGNGGNDVMYGGNGNDRLYGGDGSDTLYGGNGADKMYGGNGADVLYGYQSDDLWGGSGGDGFAFNTLAGEGGTIMARIHDYSRAEGDYIRLSAIDANPARSGNQAFAFLGYDQNGGPGSDGADRAGVTFRYERDANNAWITVVDVRSVAGAGYDQPEHYMQVWIDGRVQLTADDFIL